MYNNYHSPVGRGPFNPSSTGDNPARNRYNIIIIYYYCYIILYIIILYCPFRVYDNGTTTADAAVSHSSGTILIN